MSITKPAEPGRHYFRTLFCTALIAAQLITSAWACTTNCSITVNFIGRYTDETCEVMVNGGGSDGTVTLPKISTTALRNNGSEAGETTFNITLKNCPARRTIKLFFNSSVSAMDSETGNLLNNTGSDYSRNTQLRIRKEGNVQTIIDNALSGQEYIISAAAEPLRHQFSVSYYAQGSSAVTAGRVQAIAGVELVYQ